MPFYFIAKLRNFLLITFLSFLLSVMFLSSSIYSVPASLKAKEALVVSREYLVDISVAIANFGTEDQKSQYSAAKDDYLTSLGFFLEGNYVDAYKGVIESHIKLEKLYENLSLDYIERTSEMLQQIVKQFVDVNIEYDHDSEKVKRFYRDRESPRDRRPYDPKDFHMTYDKRPMFDNIDVGYGRLGDAKRVRQQAMDLEKWYEEGKVLDPSVHKSRIENYSIAISLCRDAKKNVIRVYQLMNRNDIYTVQTELRDNKFAVERTLLPVFDPRIPDEFKKDANDAKILVHDDEVSLKLKLEGLAGEKKSDSGNKGSNTQK